MLFSEVLEDKLQEFNPWLTEDQARRLSRVSKRFQPLSKAIARCFALVARRTQWNDETEQRQRPVAVVDLLRLPGPECAARHLGVKIEPPARAKGNRADVMFVVNGIPVTIVEQQKTEGTATP
ncbi:hypothetical protein GS563_14100 [Rhodococcus hoagii]|nr:hypothetical protein [Prescottella equi]